ncbi:Protein-serine/threonine phosphatase [Forsythia ovata]|uniref:Protein-serine/threonine phosphatase n=1 Tax=Forsythia ovata TaxID=205694 RepID=A0ABD1WX98_9LAMI
MPKGPRQRSCQILCQVSSSTVLRHEAYLAEASSVQKAFLGMDEMMCGQRGRRELALFGGKMDQPRGIIEGLIQSPKSGQVNGQIDDWFSKEGRTVISSALFHGGLLGKSNYKLVKLLIS